MENRAKMRKRPNFPGLRRGILQYVSETLEHPLYAFLITNLLLLSLKVATKLKKTEFLDQFRTVPSTFRLSFPKNYGPSLLFYYTSLSVLVLTWIRQNFVFVAYANQKLWRKNLWGSARPPPW